jgi:ribosomal protein S2
MKISNFKSKQIFKLHLLKSRAYEYAAKTNFSLTQVITNFKKALHIIFQYHQAGKKILFVGIPGKLESEINKLTCHIAVPSSFDLQGVFSNNFNQLKLNKTNKQSFSKIDCKLLLPKLSKKPDLVVLFSYYKKQVLITESFSVKVPLIIFDDEKELDKNLFTNCYNVQGIRDGLPVTFRKNLFFFGFTFLFKKIKKKNYPL